MKMQVYREIDKVEGGRQQMGAQVRYERSAFERMKMMSDGVCEKERAKD